MRPAFFLDRDGTINIDHVYINDPNKIDLICGAVAAIKKARAAGYLIVVVTNQSGVGRGIIEPDVLPKIHARLDALLEQEGAKVDLYKSCLHTPSDKCLCRKPSPYLVFEAQKELGINLAASCFVGDKLSDVACGKNASCGASILIRTGKGEAEEHLVEKSKVQAEVPDYICDDLGAAVDWFLASSKKPSSIV